MPESDMIHAPCDEMGKMPEAQRLEIRDGLRVMLNRNSQIEKMSHNVIARVEAAVNIVTQGDTPSS